MRSCGVPLLDKCRSARRALSSSTRRAVSSSPSASGGLLVEKHGDFLELIRHHGEGEVSLNTLAEHKVAVIHIDNPLKRNCLSGRMIYQLINIIDDLKVNSKHSDTVAVILRGTGSDLSQEEIGKADKEKSYHPAFCAGLDFSLAKEVVNTPSLGLEMCSMMTDSLNLLRSLDMISVALIHGPALGGGAELATSCDYRLMTDYRTSMIGFVHGKLGASPGWGGGLRLLNIVGRSKALQLLGTAEILTPKAALEVSLADSVFPLHNSSSSFLEQGVDFVKPFTNMPFPGAVKDMKYLVAGLNELYPTISEDSGNFEKSVFKKRWGSDENKIALKNK